MKTIENFNLLDACPEFDLEKIIVAREILDRQNFQKAQNAIMAFDENIKRMVDADSMGAIAEASGTTKQGTPDKLPQSN